MKVDIQDTNEMIIELHYKVFTGFLKVSKSNNKHLTPWETAETTNNYCIEISNCLVAIKNPFYSEIIY